MLSQANSLAWMPSDKKSLAISPHVDSCLHMLGVIFRLYTTLVPGRQVKATRIQAATACAPARRCAFLAELNVGKSTREAALEIVEEGLGLELGIALQ
jgi:hypothetical protein